MVKSRLKKSAPECPFECGGQFGLFGQCPHRGGANLKGASLRGPCGPEKLYLLAGVAKPSCPKYFSRRSHSKLLEQQLPGSKSPCKKTKLYSVKF